MAAAPPLAGFRVAEWTGGLAGAYATFLLCELGAEVVKVAGELRPAHPVVDRGKRSVVVDRAGWQHIVAGVDVVVTDEQGPPVAPEADLVHCLVTAWRRIDRGLPPEEALVAAAAGVQAMQWSWARRPVWLVTPVVSYMTGILAALGTVAALLARARGGAGQRLEVSGRGGALALNSGTYVAGSGREYEGSLSQHGDPRGVYPTYCLYRTADGWLFLGALTQPFWVKLMTLLERADLLAHPQLQVNPLAFGLPEIRSLVRAELDPIFAARTTAEWIAALRGADIPCGPVQTRAEFLRDPEAHALELVASVDDPLLGATLQPGVVALFSDTPAPAPRPAALPGADSDAVSREVVGWRRATRGGAAAPPRTCLEGLRILDLTSYIAGPVCPMLLADLGADVVKIESPEGDPFRMAAFGFVGWNRGKRSIVLDLKRPEGQEVFLDLARGADVLVDNLRAGVMERLDLGWERLAAANPRLIHTSITGYGSTGPLAPLPGFDPVFQARSGLCQAQGGVDDPVMHMIAYNDYCAGALGALATVAALVARDRTGRGQRVDVSLFRTAFVDQAAELVPATGAAPTPAGGRDFLGPTAARRLYSCRDGWLCIAAGSPEQAGFLGSLAGVPLALADAPDGVAARAVAGALASLSRVEALARLAGLGVPAAPCLTFAELFTDPYLCSHAGFVTLDDPSLGAVIVPGPYIDFETTPVALSTSAPRLGQHGDEILRQLGYVEKRIAALIEAGTVGRSS